MAFAITVQGSASGYLTPDIITGGLPLTSTTPGVQLADVSPTTNARSVGATQTLPAPCTRFRLIMSIKALTVGATTTGAGGPCFNLEVADNSGMSTNLTVLGPIIQGINIASATSPGTLFGEFIVVSTPKGFVRIVSDLTSMGAGSAVTYDAIIMAT